MARSLDQAKLGVPVSVCYRSSIKRWYRIISAAVQDHESSAGGVEFPRTCYR